MTTRKIDFDLTDAEYARVEFALANPGLMDALMAGEMMAVLPEILEQFAKLLTIDEQDEAAASVRMLLAVNARLQPRLREANDPTWPKGEG